MAFLFGQLNRFQERLKKGSLLPLKAAYAQSTDKGKETAPQVKNRPKKDHIITMVRTVAGIEKAIITLSECESERTAKIKVLDINGKYSYGILQFQRQTLENYTKKYGLRDKITNEDLYNPHLAYTTAKFMLTESSKNLYHWVNCAKLTGLIVEV